MMKSPMRSPRRWSLTDARTLAAWHEAAHAAVATRLGRPVSLVTIAPSQRLLGFTLHAGAMLPPSRHVEVFDLDRGDRETIERQIVITHAGSIGETLAGPWAGFVDTAETDAAFESAMGLRPRHVDLVHAAPGEVQTDRQLVDELSERLAREEAMHLSSWLRAVAHRIVHENRAAIERVAQALLEHETLDGAAITEAIGTTPP